MGTTAHDIIQWPLTNDIKNAYRMIGYDLSDVSPDRPVSPDGHKIMVEMWEQGAEIEDIRDFLRLSDARVIGELAFLAEKGLIKRRR